MGPSVKRVSVLVFSSHAFIASITVRTSVTSALRRARTAFAMASSSPETHSRSCRGGASAGFQLWEGCGAQLTERPPEIDFPEIIFPEIDFQETTFPEIDLEG